MMITGRPLLLVVLLVVVWSVDATANDTVGGCGGRDVCDVWLAPERVLLAGWFKWDR